MRCYCPPLSGLYQCTALRRSKNVVHIIIRQIWFRSEFFIFTNSLYCPSVLSYVIGECNLVQVMKQRERMKERIYCLFGLFYEVKYVLCQIKFDFASVNFLFSL